MKEEWNWYLQPILEEPTSPRHTWNLISFVQCVSPTSWKEIVFKIITTNIPRNIANWHCLNNISMFKHKIFDSDVMKIRNARKFHSQKQIVVWIIGISRTPFRFHQTSSIIHTKEQAPSCLTHNALILMQRIYMQMEPTFYKTENIWMYIEIWY